MQTLVRAIPKMKMRQEDEVVGALGNSLVVS